MHLRDGILYKPSLPLLVMLRRAQAQPCGWIAWTYRAMIGGYYPRILRQSVCGYACFLFFSIFRWQNICEKKVMLCKQKDQNGMALV
jgi:hypothetical protein